MEEEKLDGGQGTFKGRGCDNFNRWKDNNFNNFNSSHLGRSGRNFGSTYRGKGRGTYNQEMTHNVG